MSERNEIHVVEERTEETEETEYEQESGGPWWLALLGLFSIVAIVIVALLLLFGWFRLQERENTFRECMRIRPVAECSVLLPEAR